MVVGQSASAKNTEVFRPSQETIFGLIRDILHARCDSRISGVVVSLEDDINRGMVELKVRLASVEEH